MKQLLIIFGAICGLLCDGSRTYADDDGALKGALLQKIALPLLKEKVAGLDKATPAEIHYGLKGKSVGRNGLREEVENRDIVRKGKKVNETRYNFFDKYAWAQKGGTWGPPGFQYYVYRHPLALTFDPKALEFTLSTKLEFKVAVAINYDTGAFYFKPWVFADSGFGDKWPNEVEISIKSKVMFNKDNNLSTKTSTHIHPKKPIILQTLHGAVKRDCSPEVVSFLKGEMDKIATRLDAEVAKTKVKQAK